MKQQVNFLLNLLNLIPDLKEKQFNVLSEPILIRDSYLPNFKTLLISTSKNYKKKTISYKDLELERLIQRFTIERNWLNWG